MTSADGSYPAGPVRIVEPFGMGGGPDLLARALAPKLSKFWGQSVAVENLPGAGATAGPALVAKSPADGHTLLLNTSAHAYSAALLKHLPYDPLRDFIATAPLTQQGYALVTGRATGIDSLGAIIAAAKAAPGVLKFGSTGIGTGTHLGAEKFNQAAGIEARHVPPAPNGSIADTVANVVAGRFTYCLVPIDIVLSHIRDGTLLALGVSSARRSILLPDVPTIAEAGVSGFDFPIWYGVWVPAGTATRVVEKLSQDIGVALADLSDSIAAHGGEVMRMTQPEFVRFVECECQRAAEIMKTVDLGPE